MEEHRIAHYVATQGNVQVDEEAHIVDRLGRAAPGCEPSQEDVLVEVDAIFDREGETGPLVSRLNSCDE
jgi:hypothetical protein